MSSTRPPGARTQLVSPGCYAAPLRDCDGGPLSREHYISRALLERFGPTFTAEGLPWTEGPRKVSPSALVARVLCERHNSALSPLDSTIANFYDVLAEVHAGRRAGAHGFDGEDLERWALKVLLGLVASGNVRAGDGRKEDPVAPPELHLRVLFGENELADGCGFFYIGDPVVGLDSGLLDVAINRYPQTDIEAGAIFGVTVKLLGFQFVTTVTARLQVAKQRVWHRPGGFQLGEPERGRIGLRWKRASSPTALVLKMPSPESKHAKAGRLKKRQLKKGK